MIRLPTRKFWRLCRFFNNIDSPFANYEFCNYEWCSYNVVKVVAALLIFNFVLILIFLNYMKYHITKTYSEKLFFLKYKKNTAKFFFFKLYAKSLKNIISKDYI